MLDGYQALTKRIISHLKRNARILSLRTFILMAFIIRFSNKLIGQRCVKNVWYCHLGSSMERFYQTIWAPTLPQMLHDILDHDNMQWHPLLIRCYIPLWPCHQIDLITDFIIVLIKSDLNWCIHRSRSLFWYLNFEHPSVLLFCLTKSASNKVFYIQ